MISDFELALRELADRTKSLSNRLLANLSSPTRAESDAFAAYMRQTDAERRREILARMVQMSEANFSLDYVILFRACLNDPDAIVRRHAIEGLWEDETLSLVEPLIRLLASDPDVDVRAAAAASLGRFVFLGECEELDERRTARIRNALESAIDNAAEDPQVVRRAVEAIAYINDNRVRRIIDRAYASEDNSMRESAVFAMGRSADLFWADTVLSELSADSAAMRYEAARACGELQLKSAVGPLIKLGADPDREVQSMAAWALGQIGGKRARAALESWAASDDEALSQVANEAIQELEFSNQPLDLLVYNPDDSEVAQIELDEEDEEEDESFDEDDEDDDAFEKDEEWTDDVLKLDE
jgi:HEAT repeat protein